MAEKPVLPHLRQIRSVAVLGAGTMGSRIAAHLANAGLSVLLLDLVPPGTPADAPGPARNRLALSAIEALRTTQPAAFYTPAAASLIMPGNFDDHLPRLANCDWILEAVAEDLAVKCDLLTRILPHRRPGTITTTNTSGLPVAGILSSLDPELTGDLRRHWFGTHFFNPPRYMRLVELIPTPDTDPADLAAITQLCDLHLGKSVVRSRDTPNFIANRIGTFALANAIRLMQAQYLSVEEVDALTGTPIGWPKTGTFRLADLVGIDVLSHVAANLPSHHQSQPAAPAATLPPFIHRMLENRWFGDKTRQGFYRKAGKDPQGRDLRDALDWQTLTYKPATRPRLPALEMAKTITSVAARIPHLLQLSQPGASTDKAAAFYQPFLSELFNYAAGRLSPENGRLSPENERLSPGTTEATATEPAASIVEIDTAMRAGFNWELGPFELFDAAGVLPVTEAMRAAGVAVAGNTLQLLAHAAACSDPSPSWYKPSPDTPSGRLYFDPFANAYLPVELPPGTLSLAALKRAHGVVTKNPGASLIDLGDGVAGIELHSKMNALGGDIVSFLSQTLKPTSDAVATFEAFVLTGDSVNFSVGANLLQLLLAVQEDDWDEVDLMIRAFQGMTQLIKFCPRPVVVAPFGLCLGGGAEIVLHAAATQSHAETYIGLVETGVGLIPGGGGCKEMVLRSLEVGSSATGQGSARSLDSSNSINSAVFEALRRNFEAIAKATVSTSAAGARTLGLLRPTDGISVNRDRLLADAKHRARDLADLGYIAPQPRSDLPVPGASALATLKLAVWTLREGHFISDHDATVANHLAHILCGGPLAPNTFVSEQYLLDLEREAFLSLCGEKKTQDRIAFTLKTGKPLRN